MKTIVGKVVCVAFWDHSQSSGVGAGPILCTVYGKLNKATKLHFEILCWDIPGSEGDSNAHNQEMFSILRSTIVEMFVFNKGRRILNYK